MNKIDQTTLKELLFYDPITGYFSWKFSRRGAKAGSLAGTKGFHDYIIITIFRKRYRAHRLAWLYMTGEWPKCHTDHINRKCDDNRISNLRECSVYQNSFNQGKHKNNTTGMKGVIFNKTRKKYIARIVINGRIKYLGTFTDLDKAGNAYDAASLKYHKEFNYLGRKVAK